MIRTGLPPRWLTLLPLLLSLAAGCATSHTLSAWDAHDALSLANRAIGGSHDLQLVMIPTRGATADAEFLEASRYYGRSGMAEQVADTFSAATNGPVELALVGRNSEKTAQVMHDALTLAASNDLSRLTLVYLGDPAFAPDLETLARKHGVRLFTVAYPPPDEAAPAKTVDPGRVDRNL